MRLVGRCQLVAHSHCTAREMRHKDNPKTSGKYLQAPSHSCWFTFDKNRECGKSWQVCINKTILIFQREFLICFLIVDSRELSFHPPTHTHSHTHTHTHTHIYIYVYIRTYIYIYIYIYIYMYVY